MPLCQFPIRLVGERINQAEGKNLVKEKEQGIRLAVLKEQGKPKEQQLV